MPMVQRSSFLLMGFAALLLSACEHQPGGLFAPPPAPAIVPADQNFGQVVGSQYVVAPGDTVAAVSARTNTPIRTLIDMNRLTPPYALRPGQRLSLQPRSGYVVQRGDTVSGIAARQGVSVSALIQLNDLRPPYTLQVGQRLVVPSGADAPMAVVAAQDITPAAGAPEPKPYMPAGQPTQIGAAPTAAPASDAQHTNPGGGISSGGLPPLQGAPAPTNQGQAAEAAPAPPQPQLTQLEPAPPAAKAPQGDPLPEPHPNSAFIWPIDGKVISKFGPAKDNLRNDGINITAPNGAPVRASADGVVAYAGNELRGFGNMVLLRHADGWVTAYAHNSSLLVEKGAKVRQGDVIARIGSTGNVDTPQLHFELRQGTKAVDPMKVLTR